MKDRRIVDVTDSISLLYLPEIPCCRVSQRRRPLWCQILSVFVQILDRFDLVLVWASLK